MSDKILTPTLTLESTGGSTGVSENASLSLSVTDSLTVVSPTAMLTRIIVDGTGANNIFQPSGDGQTRYIYVKHTGTSDGTTAVTTTLHIEKTDNTEISKLAADEFAFFPSTSALQLQSSSDNIVAEFAYFTKG